jgi:RNA polymerase sigma factor (sigma-70 family)
MTDAEGATSLTLLDRVRLHRRERPDPEACERFAQLYRPIVFARCVRMGLQPADAEDVTHEVLLRLLDGLVHFERRRAGSFRRYLTMAARSGVLDLIRSRGRANERQIGSGLEAIPARPEEPEEVTVGEIRRSAMELLRERFGGDERTLEAVRLRLAAGMPAKQVGALLGMTEGAVNTATCRMKKLIRERFADLIPEDEA